MLWDLMNLATGQRVPGSCDTYACDWCGPRRMGEWPFVLSTASPERLVTLTLAPPDRERRRGQVRDLKYRVRARGYACEWAWNTERNPKGTGFHIHLLQHGDYIPQRELQDLWGGRRVDIRAIRATARDVVGLYIVKESLDRSGYIVKESLSLDGRPVHLSRGYLRGFKVDEVRAQVREMRFGVKSDGDEWVRVPRIV